MFTGTGLTGDTITLFDGTTIIGSATVDVSNAWSIVATTLAEGPNVITATQTDVYGNVSVPSAALNVIIDTLPPDVTAQLAIDTGQFTTDSYTSNATLTGTGDANGIVTIANNATVLGSATADATGAWSFT